MTTKPIVHDDAPPAVQIAGGNGEYRYGSVDTTVIRHAHELANNAYMFADSFGEVTDDERVRLLQAAVKQLADAVTSLTGEVSQLARGARSGVISVHD
ncbi:MULTISPECIES: hypothetical protein [unclassified Curtobacterium]|uniref:hypothetical protein n=1 Tax=unclassified Curtobacterium TaxID=257496 RepID=UPI0038180586